MIQKVPSYKTPPHTIPFSAYKWVDIWHQTIGRDWESYILNSNYDVIAPFARKNNELIFSGGNEVADYLDIIGTDEAKKKAWPEIIEFIKKDGITSLHLNNIPETSPTLLFFKPQKEDTTPTISLPSSWDKYLYALDHKNKHELERKIRKFERENTDIEIRESTNPVIDVDMFLSLMKLDPQKNSFLTPNMEQFFRDVIQSFAENILLTILTVGHKPAAATMAFKFSNELLLYNSGFDASCSGAGFYIKATNMKRAIASGYTTYNFLQGHERYKYELGGKDFFVYRIDANL